MAEKRMLIVDAEVARKVDESRGEMSRSEFINFLIEGQFSEDKEYKGDTGKQNYVTKEELHRSLQGVKELLRTFLEFFLSYGLEVGKHSDKNFNELSQKLQALVNSKTMES
ncbi:MAG: hypothetical protein HQ588_03625 [Deltaproteobacteria bacterium]|nr:hypothetical protein [Deltaproteobacteria bacterium]